MPAKKKTKSDVPPQPLPTKESFFKPKREMMTQVSAPRAQPPPQTVAVTERRRTLLYERGTGVAYAEVVDGVARCLYSGQELFTMGRKTDDDFPVETAGGRFNGFDFTPPRGRRHPNDNSVDADALVKAGIISNEDIVNRRQFSREELDGFMRRLLE